LRTVAAISDAHWRMPSAVTMPTSSSPSSSAAPGKATTPPFSVPTLPTITLVASPAKMPSPSMVTVASNGLRVRASRNPARR